MTTQTSNTVQEVLKGFIERKFLEDDATVAFDDDLLMGGLIDSLGVIHLVTFLQEEYSVTISPADITVENFSTINTIADYLQTRINAI